MSIKVLQRGGYTRRTFVAFVAGVATVGLPSTAFAQAGEQNEWRYCGKCHGLFYDGYTSKGPCPADGSGHSAIGFNFSIEYNSHQTQELPGRTRQYNWRFCNKCEVMFYDGYPGKGVCPIGGGHVAQGYMFGLWDVNGPSFPHDRMQSDWRFCNKCQVLYFDGYADKGRCAAGGGHVAQGLNFKLFNVDTTPTQVASPAPKPNITVGPTQPFRSHVFVVTGSGFLPSSRVNIRVADDALIPTSSLNTNSNASGAISTTLTIPCQAGNLHFSANDGRSNSQDITGTVE
jgi:hypothetical protein